MMDAKFDVRTYQIRDIDRVNAIKIKIYLVNIAINKEPVLRAITP